MSDERPGYVRVLKWIPDGITDVQGYTVEQMVEPDWVRSRVIGTVVPVYRDRKHDGTWQALDMGEVEVGPVELSVIAAARWLEGEYPVPRDVFLDEPLRFRTAREVAEDVDKVALHLGLSLMTLMEYAEEQGFVAFAVGHDRNGWWASLESTEDIDSCHGDTLAQAVEDIMDVVEPMSPITDGHEDEP